MAAPFAEVFASLAAALSGTGLRWYVFGAQAAIVHGASRVTADVDVTVLPGDRTIADIVSAFVGAGFSLRTSDPEFVRRTSVLPLVHDATGIPIDVVLAGPGLEESFADRARVVEIAGSRVPIASAEDVIVMKTLAGRPKDIEDVVAIVGAKAAALDARRIEETLSALEQALDRSDLVSTFQTIRRRSVSHRPAEGGEKRPTKRRRTKRSG